jgi:prepilin signal peptidase PulO-like enzyme (type II secretory pathway)
MVLGVVVRWAAVRMISSSQKAMRQGVGTGEGMFWVAAARFIRHEIVFVWPVVVNDLCAGTAGIIFTVSAGIVEMHPKLVQRPRLHRVTMTQQQQQSQHIVLVVTQ